MDTMAEGGVGDEEPRLKYYRMENDVLGILERDSVSCIAIHPKFVCVGTRWGLLYLLDHEGNSIHIPTTATTNNTSGTDKPTTNTNTNTNTTPTKGLQAHTIAVNHISVDLSGDHVATCSNDGNLNLHGLYSSENNALLPLGKAVNSVALDPYFSKAGCRFIVGDDKLNLYEKSFFSRTKCTTLCESEGCVQSVAWQDRFVAWASDIGVRVYDVAARCSLGLIRWDSGKTESIKKYRCNLLWSADRTLMIGWVDTIRICAIRKRKDAEIQTRAVPEYFVDPQYTFQTDHFICGLAPLDNQLVTLGFCTENDPATDKAQHPTLNIYDYKECEFSEISSDTLNIKGYEDYGCNDYHLACVSEENKFFIVSPKEIVIVSQLDIDDKVQWLIDHEYYERAMRLLENAPGESSKHSVSSVGICHMDRLIEKEEYENAAKIYGLVCSLDKSLWEKEFYKFARTNNLRAVCEYVPKTLEKKLSKKIYDMIVYENIKYDPASFLDIIKKWDPQLYNVNAVISAVMEQLLLNDADKLFYLEALGILYCHQQRYDKALSTYLKLQHKDVFKLIEVHNLHSFIHDRIYSLMKLDCDKAISMLIRKVPVEVVEEQLESHDLYLYKYLDTLSKLESSGKMVPSSGGKYHEKLVKLYTEYAREKLLPFLKSSDSYKIEDALEICKAKNFHPETVYLLGSRIGNTKEALNIIIEKLKDINQAILFCQEHDDEDLWLDLIRYSIDKPEYITLLLKRIGNFVDPTALVRGIKSGCEIQDLKDSLGKMMRDFNLQLSVQGAYKAITFRNYFDLHERLVRSHQKGICITDEYVCSGCHGKIMKDLSHSTDIVVYNCRHIFHMECDPEVNRYHNICALCNPVKSD